MIKTNILITFHVDDQILAGLEASSDQIDVNRTIAKTPAQISAAIDEHPGAEALFTTHSPDRWESDWKVRWIQVNFAGADHIDFGLIPEDVVVTTVSGANNFSITEHVFAMILSLRRQLPEIAELQRQRKWPDRKTKWKRFSPPLLMNGVLGILGYGSIGREIARVGKAFGLRTLAYKRNPFKRKDSDYCLPGTGDPQGIIPEEYYGPDSLYEFLGKCDIVVNALPSTADTEGLMDGNAFECIKDGSIFINIGRGNTVDEEALYKALKKGRLSAAGLDVFHTEPLPDDSPLWRCDNVIVSPHLSGIFKEYNEFTMELFKDNLDRYLKGKELLNLVDRLTGY